MKIFFKEKDSKQVLRQLQSSIKKKELKEQIKIKLTTRTLDIEINYLGQSKLSFSLVDSKKGSLWKLSSQEISWAHQFFERKALEKIKEIIKEAGGLIKIVSSA